MIRALAEAATRTARHDDLLAPGVVVSKISWHQWYASVLRYPKDGSKVVVCNAKDCSYGRVVLALGLALLVAQQRTDRLAAAYLDGARTLQSAVRKALS